jgi:uncharacterized protein (DUF58 family)
MRPTGTGIAAFAGGLVLLLAAGVLRYPELAVLGAGALAALLAALAWTLRGATALEAVRGFSPAKPRAGDLVEVEVVLDNVGTRASADALAVDRIDGHGHEVFIPALAAGQRAATRYAFTAPRRGHLEVERLTVGRGDPLGLWVSRRQIGDAGHLPVHPAWRPGLRPLVFAAPQDDEGAVSAASAAGGMVFHSLRDYQPGDPWRLISWRATARRGKPTVRHLVVPDESYQTLVLEADAHAYRSPEQFEEAVRIAATLAVAVRRAGLGLDLVVTGNLRMVPPLEPVELRRPGNAEQALDLLTDVRRRADAESLASVLMGLAFHPEGAVLGVVTGQLRHPVTLEAGGDPAAAAANYRDRYRRQLTEARRKFQGVYVIEVGARTPEAELGGTTHLSVDDCEDFERQWRTLTES